MNSSVATLNPPSLPEIGQLYFQISGEKQATTRSFAELLKALEAGHQVVIVQIPWYEQREDLTCYTNQIVVQFIRDGRVYFANPLRSGKETPGDTIAGNAQGPERQTHASGLQSMDIKVFEQLFKIGGGQALINAA